VKPVDVKQGQGPIVLGIPHSGTFIPPDVFARLTPIGQSLADTDWHVDRLYSDILPGATSVRANFHRYVIDANRDPSGASLYPGQNTTGLVPVTSFDGEPIWTNAPGTEEIEARRVRWHAPYHAALAGELERVLGMHGVAVLYDCHSIRSRVPFLFEGRLPDFNIGTNSGRACDPRLADGVEDVCRRAPGYTMVRDGRFRGGWTTRHYGRPAQGVHAIQMELAQSTYLESETAPFQYDARKADNLREHIGAVLRAIEFMTIKLESR
jgi:formiminoglutamase|tara:strand:+ start:196 stop:993 length:798 start_codon:yes stop_codon:yes gene_type:complete